MNAFRCFLAIHLNAEIQKILGNIQDDLKMSEADVKWVEPKNIHLTLKFLGDVPMEKINEINTVVPQSISEVKPFELNLSGAGAFPKIEFPKVIWVGVKDSDNQLKNLAHKLGETLLTIQFPREEREFTGHITLGRVRSSNQKAALIKALQQLRFPPIPSQIVKSCTLFKSILTSQGPIYDVLNEYRFK